PVPTNGEMGRINLAAVPGSPDSSTAIIYALAGNQNGSATVAIMKSMDGGASWTIVAQGKNTAPTNPTPGATGTDCMTMDIGHGQSQYDLAIAVDPGNPNNVVIGGNLFRAPPVDGGATWRRASDRLSLAAPPGPPSPPPTPRAPT